MEWLVEKKASFHDEDSGSYTPEDKSAASFRWARASHAGKSWRMLRTEERAPSGRQFNAAISLTDTGETVVVYVSLEAGAAGTSSVGRIATSARCPRYVRQLLALSGDWYHGVTKIMTVDECFRLTGTQAGDWLAEEIRSARRTMPIVVVSEFDGEPVFPRSGDNIARDLSGLANVFRVDEDASWGLTNRLGKERSCYLGAVRLYWPRFRDDADRYCEYPWTAAQLGFGEDRRIQDQLRRDLSRAVMEASALSVIRPHEIDEIRAGATAETLDGLRSRATSADDWMRIADEYDADNRSLREELAKLQTENENLSSMLAELETRHRAVEPGRHSIAPGPSKNDEEQAACPPSGEIRFYKKRDVGGHDKMERIKACNHNAWQESHRGEKAKKAIARLEGSNEWKRVQKCGTCTGGGVWRVEW